MQKVTLEDSNYSNLNSIQMLCDKPLTTKREIKEPFANCSFFMSIIGPPGSGKSSLMLQMISSKKDKIYYRVFKDIMYVCPSSSRSSVKDNPLDDVVTFDNLNYDVLEEVQQNKERYDKQDKNYNQLLIIDDCGSFLKDSSSIDMLNELSMNRRHISLSIIILVQYMVSIPRSVRSQLSSVIMFKPANNEDLETIRKEFVSMKKKDFENLSRFVFRFKHDNLFIDRGNNELYKNLQKINFN